MESQIFMELFGHLRYFLTIRSEVKTWATMDSTAWHPESPLQGRDPETSTPKERVVDERLKEVAQKLQRLYTPGGFPYEVNVADRPGGAHDMDLWWVV